MNADLLFSIIVPTYNRAAFIRKTIQSALTQTYPNVEIIVVDDGSTDETERIIRSIADSRLHYYYKANGERGAARNFGMARATGHYVTFLDSDDLLYPDYLANAKESIIRDNFPAFFHLAYEVTDEQMRPLTKVDYLKPDDIFVLVRGNPLSCLGIFLHQSITGKFKFNEDRDLAGSEDWEMWLRVAANVGIKTDNRVSAALIDHNSRSVINYNEKQLVRRKEVALQSAFADPAVQEKFTPYLNRMIAYCDTYIALHLVLSGQHQTGLTYLRNAVIRSPVCLFERRTAAIFKHVLLNQLR